MRDIPSSAGHRENAFASFHAPIAFNLNVAGDWTPRQNQLGWIDSTLNGGVTTMISAGEVHTPGRPRDVVGVKAMAIFAQRAFCAFRPGGVKVHAGAPVIEPGMARRISRSSPRPA